MWRFLASLIIVAVLSPAALALQAEKARSAEAILHRFVDDFRHDPAANENITFAVHVEGVGDWHVTVAGQQGAEKPTVALEKGLPAKPTVSYTLDFATLEKLDQGELNALTAMARARGSDLTPMDINLMPGFQPDPTFLARFIPFTFHFWTRGLPEVVPFGKRHSRLAHGGNVVVFYYQKGLRSGWAQIEKGQHMNKDPEDQINPFPSMFIGIRGRAEAKIGGKQVTMSVGEMLFVPAGVSHELWNPYDEPAEVVLLMFGEGA